MAGHALHADGALALGAALHVLQVRLAQIALQRLIAGRVAVLAARVLEHRAHLFPGDQAAIAAAAAGRRLAAAARGDEERARGERGQTIHQTIHQATHDAPPATLVPSSLRSNGKVRRRFLVST